MSFLHNVGVEIASRLNGNNFSTRIIPVNGGCEVLVAGDVNGEIFIRPDINEIGFALDFIFSEDDERVVKQHLVGLETEELGWELQD